MGISYQFEAAAKLTANDPKKRKPKRVRTLGTLELESKVELTDPEQVVTMIDRIRNKSDGISKASVREQFHTVFADNADGYTGVVLVKDSDYVGVRSKNTGELLATPELKLPAYVRNETSFEPTDEGYVSHMQQVFRQRKIGCFDKRCADLAFWVGRNSFTATVSIVDEPDKREGGCYQLELEFDGHEKGTAAPTVAQILADFEVAFGLAFENMPPSTVTKLEWLAKKTGNEDIVPKYSIKPATASEMLILKA